MRRQAEQRAEQAEERAEQAEERVEQGLRRGVEDLCTVLGLAWDSERNAQVERLSASQLEVLRAHLVQEKSCSRTAPSAAEQANASPRGAR